MHASEMPWMREAITRASERAHMPRVRKPWLTYERICWLWYVGFAIAIGLIAGTIVWEGLR